MPSELRVVIVNHAGSRQPSPLRNVLGSLPDVVFAGEAASSSQTLRLVAAANPHLLLIELGGSARAGLAIARGSAGARVPLFAFVGDDRDAAFAAFEAGALDYLLRPVTAARIRGMLERARQRLGPEVRPKAVADRLAVKRGRETLLLAVDDIASIVAEGEVLHITTVKNERLTTKSYRLKELEARLDTRSFVRLSRSAIANVRSIAKLTSLSSGNCMASLSNRQEIVVSRAHTRSLRHRFLRN